MEITDFESYTIQPDPPKFRRRKKYTAVLLVGALVFGGIKRGDDGVRRVHGVFQQDNNSDDAADEPVDEHVEDEEESGTSGNEEPADTIETAGSGSGTEEEETTTTVPDVTDTVPDVTEKKVKPAPKVQSQPVGGATVDEM